MSIPSARYHRISSGAMGAPPSRRRAPGAGPSSARRLSSTSQSAARCRARSQRRGPPALEAALRHAHAGPDRPRYASRPERRRLPHAQRDPGVELLPDPRHREEHARGHLAEVVRHGVDALGEVDGPRCEWIEHRERALGDVAEGQEGELLVARSGLADEVGEAELEEDVAMTQHCALGWPRGARGVHEDREIVRPGDLDGVEGAACSLSYRAPSSSSASNGITCSSAKPCRPSMSNTTILTSCGHRPRTSRILSSCSSFPAKRNRAAVVDDVLDLRRRVRGVDAVGHPAPRTSPRGRCTATPGRCPPGWPPRRAAEAEGHQPQAGGARAPRTRAT